MMHACMHTRARLSCMHGAMCAALRCCNAGGHCMHGVEPWQHRCHGVLEGQDVLRADARGTGTPRTSPFPTQAEHLLGWATSWGTVFRAGGNHAVVGEGRGGEPVGSASAAPRQGQMGVREGLALTSSATTSEEPLGSSWLLPQDEGVKMRNASELELCSRTPRTLHPICCRSQSRGAACRPTERRRGRRGC